MLLSYRFFGDSPGEPLPSLNGFAPGKRTNPNKEGVKPLRQSIRIVPYGEFTSVPDTKALIERLFGLANAKKREPVDEGGADV
jgi:hypothetical protein